MTRSPSTTYACGPSLLHCSTTSRSLEKGAPMSTPTARSRSLIWLRRGLLGAGVAVLLVLAVTLDSRRRGRPRKRPANATPAAQITHENYQKIKPGMTRAEVEAILHGPAGDHTEGLRDDYDVTYSAWSCDGPLDDLFDRTECERGRFHSRPSRLILPGQVGAKEPPEDPEEHRPVPPEKVHPSSPGGQIAIWWGRQCAIAVEFDADGKVHATSLGWYAGATEKPEPPETEADFLDRLAEMLGL
jgi:hypothetical protein